MLIREVTSAFWQTLKDTWEELLPLSMVNLAWLLAWVLPMSGAYVLRAMPAVSVSLLVLAVLLFGVGMAGVYAVTHRVAHAKTFHFEDFLQGVRRFWWRAVLWVLANILLLVLVWTNLRFYPAVFQGTWVALIIGLWLAVLAIWIVMQAYFWPLMMAQEQPKMFLAWRNSLYLILANPFYAFFVFLFGVFLAILSLAFTLPFIFAGMTLQGLLGNNAVLTLLARYDVIAAPRPKIEH